MPKKTLRLPALMLFGIYAIYSFGLYPFWIKISNDIVLNSTPLYEVVKILYNLIQWLGLAIAFGFIIYNIFRYSVRRTVSLFVLTGCALLFKYISFAFVQSFLDSGTLNLTSGYVDKYYLPLIWTFLGDCLFVALVALLTHVWVTRLQRINQQKEASCKRLNKKFEPEGETLPITKLFNRKNPLLRAAFWGILAYAILQALSFLVLEIIYGLQYSYYIADFFWSSYEFITQILIPTALCYPTAIACVKLAERYRLRLEAQQAAEDEENDDTAESE